MNRYFKIILSLLFTLGLNCQESDSIQNLIDEAVHRAKVATFYSATYSNGWDEIQLAKSYTDSAENLLLRLGNEGRDVALSNGIIKGLKEELEVSISISEDNINYIYPVSSLMSGHRDDFVVQDDAGELLVESLIEKVLSQNDPLNKGKIEDNIDFLVFQIKPYNRTHLLVASDFLATSTGHYVIRHHELAEILGDGGLERFENDELSIEDWNLICDFYGIDKLLNLKVVDQNPQIDDLYYKGIIINAVYRGEVPKYVSYFEGFKVDKISSWNNAIILSLLNSLLTWILLYLLGSVSFSWSSQDRGRFGPLRFLFSPDRLIGLQTTIITLLPLPVIIGVNYLSAPLAPEINAYFKSPQVIVWVIFQSVVPFLTSVVITYLALFKMPNVVVNNSKGFSRILFGSWVGQLTILSFYEYHSELFPTMLLSFVDIVPAISLTFVCAALGLIADKVMKRESVTIMGKLFALVSILLAVLSFWFELHELYLLGNTFYSVLAMASLFILFNPSSISGGIPLNSIESKVELWSLFNPLKWYKKGTNLESVKTALASFVLKETNESKIALLKGEYGSGKTRLLKELVLDLGANSVNKIVWFQGDCNSGTESDQEQYEPFYEAFSSKGNLFESAENTEFTPLVAKGFFEDRTTISKAFNEVVSKAGSIAPLDLTQVLSIEDSNARTQDEIASELVDIIVSRYLTSESNIIVLALDDIHFIDALSLELLKTIVSLVESRKLHSDKFKFVFTTTFEHQERALEILNELKNLTDNKDLNEFDIQIESIKDFTTEVLSDEYFNYDNSRGFNVPYRFDSKIKGHLREVILEEKNQVMPKDVLGYLENIRSKGYLNLEDGVYRLREVPALEDVDILDTRSQLLLDGFEDISTDLRSLIESAAVIGYKFDAELLAYIWNIDLLSVISKLETLEGRFIKDLSDQDNMYSFTSKVLYRKVLELSKGTSESGHSRQLIIEYQKRIIKSIIEKDEDGNPERFDSDLLLNAAERCFEFMHIEMINLHMSRIVLTAAQKLANQGKREQCTRYLERLYNHTEKFSADDLLLLSRVLQELTKNDRSTENLEFKRSSGTQLFLDEILVSASSLENECLDHQNSSLALVAVVAMGGIMHSVRTKQYDYSEISGLKSSRDEQANVLSKRFKYIKKLVTERKLRIIRPVVRIEFYEALMRMDRGETLVKNFKDALNANYPKLAGEIARQITLDANVPKEERLRYLMASLQFLRGESLNFNEFKQLKIADSALKGTIETLLKSKKLSTSEAQDLNFLLSRVREHFMEIKDFDYVLTLSELALSLSSKLGDSRGITFALSYTGAVLYKMGKFDQSIQVYKEYGEHLLRINATKYEFYYALEGLVRNSIELKEYSSVKALFEDIEANGIHFTNSDYQEELQFSLFDSSSDLESLIDQWKSL